MNKKKFIFTVAILIGVLLALCWVFWLVFYFDATIDGSIAISYSGYALFERNYLVPIQIFGITIAFSVLTFIFYPKLLKKKVIGKKYIILAIISTLPFWYLAVCHLHTIITCFDIIYR